MSTWIIAGGLFALLAWIVVRSIRKAKQGGCAGGCAGCAGCSKDYGCHKEN